MGLGNGNSKSGNKGSNHSFEHRILLAMGEVIAASGGAPPPPGGFSTEATQLLVLNAIANNDKDFEILLVRDNGNGGEVVQQITDLVNNTTTYKDVNGAAYVPVGPLEYLDPAAVLNLMLTELTSITTNTQPALLQTCAHIDLAGSTGVFGAGSRSFTIALLEGSAEIGGLVVDAPYSTSFSADSNGTLGGVPYDATINPAVVIRAVRVQ